MSSSLFFFTSSDDEDEVNGELVFFTEVCIAVIQASKPNIPRNQVDGDRYGAHDRLMAAYFSEHPQFNEATFRADRMGKVGIFPLMKCTSAIPVIELYGNEYLQSRNILISKNSNAHHDQNQGFPGMIRSIDLQTDCGRIAQLH
ncbi:hypothetical protein Tco_0957761 [Tanacetum coccineum]